MPKALQKTADNLRAETSAERDRQREQAEQNRQDQDFLDQWFRVAQSWSFAILHTDRRPQSDQFFREGEQRFRELAEAIIHRGWDKYLPMVVERVQELHDSQAKARQVLVDCLVAACDPSSQPGEIANVLAAAADRWPMMEGDLVRDQQICLSTLHQNGGQWPAPASETAQAAPVKSADPTPDPNAAEPARDGPIAPSSFAWGKKLHDGLSGKEWLLVSELWKAPQRTRTFQELAGPVWGDHAQTPSVTQIRSAAKRATRFFTKKACPLRIQVVTTSFSNSTGEREYSVTLIRTDAPSPSSAGKKKRPAGKKAR